LKGLETSHLGRSSRFTFFPQNPVVPSPVAGLLGFFLLLWPVGSTTRSRFFGGGFWRCFSFSPPRLPPSHRGKPVRIITFPFSGWAPPTSFFLCPLLPFHSTQRQGRTWHKIRTHDLRHWRGYPLRHPPFPRPPPRQHFSGGGLFWWKKN